MKKILIFTACIELLMGRVYAAVRDGNATMRTTNTDRQVAAAIQSSAQSRNVGGTRIPSSVSSSRAATTAVTSRSTANTGRATTRATSKIIARTPTASRVAVTRSATNPKLVTRVASSVAARAATDTNASTITETQTGAAYEQCKTAFFTCMDQFCTLKNDDYRRCACSDRIYDLTAQLNVLQEAGEQLTVFTENLDVVGMTAAQAAAMRNASDGEMALTSDKSASKALLQAIMNSIRGQDASVGGKYADLNSINISFDASTAFGTMDAAQAVATYNGQSLYKSVYPQCRNLVRSDCNDASLQRAINAYLMAIEQDCNTVQTAIENKQKEMKSAVREGSAMLDLARVENRQKHNSDDITTCVANVKSAILSEEVCGANYHKCLDNGEFIDVSTGAPITGVVNFYQLQDLLKFSDGVDAADQKLSKVSNNRQFVQNFENRVKKFAQPALDKCTEHADEVWDEYLDQALLDIFYAQTAKVKEIRQGCFDFISACYENNDASITAAMKELTGTKNSVLLQPSKVELTSQMCTDYMESCNNMFDNNIITEYVESRNKEDLVSACRAVIKQCFDQYGGTNYHNFYYPYSGVINQGYAPDWFTLYEYTVDDKGHKIGEPIIKSECAKQAAAISACSDKSILEVAFGGFDKTTGEMMVNSEGILEITIGYNKETKETKASYPLYGTLDVTDNGQIHMKHHRALRPSGVATETYNQVIDILSTQCTNVAGRFTEIQNVFASNKYGYNQKINDPISTSNNICLYNGDNIKSYGLQNHEDMCPNQYILNVDTLSWGACLCWENGGRRSKNGTATNCSASLPVQATIVNERTCTTTDKLINLNADGFTDVTNWCITNNLSDKNQVCTLDGCSKSDLSAIPEGIQ